MDSFRLFTLDPALDACWPAALAGFQPAIKVDPSWQF